MAVLSSESIPASIPAGVLVGPRRLEIRQIPMWPIEEYGDPDLVLIRVAACGVCGSDFRYYAGENPWAQHTLGRFVPNPPNIVLGHEYSGTVVAVLGEQNRHLLGKRVAPICSKICGACEECRAGRTRLCRYTVHMGHGQGWGRRDYFPGAYSTHTLAWGASCFEIPGHVSFEEAAMMDILAVAVHVAEQGQIRHGRPVLCLGAGPAGNGIAQVATLTGASSAVLVDRSTKAIQIAQEQQIGTVVPSSSDLVKQLDSLAPSGFGTVFDSIGAPETFELGLSVLGNAGTFVSLAVHDQSVPLNLMRLPGERKIVTSCNFEIGDYPKALAWLSAGRLKVKEWLEPVALKDLPAIFEDVVSGSGPKEVFKLVLDPTR